MLLELVYQGAIFLINSRSRSHIFLNEKRLVEITRFLILKRLKVSVTVIRTSMMLPYLAVHFSSARQVFQSRVPPPVSYQLVEMLPMTPIFVPPPPVTRQLASTFFHSSRFPPPFSLYRELQLARANVRRSLDQPGFHLPSRLFSVKPMSPLRRTDTPMSPSRLVSTSASSGSRGCHRQELSTRVKIITLKERIGTDCGSSIPSLAALSIRSTAIVRIRTNERTNERTA